jgi:AcrR family transcriptional regulator
VTATAKQPIDSHARRPKVSGTEASVRLVDATIDLMSRLPFDEVSVRRITEHADLNPSTVLRNFGTVQNLYNAVSAELLRRSTVRLGQELNPAALFDDDVVLRTKLLAWLLANGIDPEAIAVSPHDAPVVALVDNIVERRGVARRTAAAFNEILAYAAEGFVVFNEIHTQDSQVRADSLTLMQHFEVLLPELEKKLGWT